MYWLVLLDDYSAGFGLMVVVIATCLVVTRVYGMGSVPRGARGTACCGHPAVGQSRALVPLHPPGIKRFCRDIHMMLGFKPGPYFRACWMVLSPATMMVTSGLVVLRGASTPG